METMTDTPCHPGTAPDTASTEDRCEIDQSAHIRGLLRLVVDAMRANSVDKVEMKYAGYGDAQNQFSVDPELPGTYAWCDGCASPIGDRTGTFYEMCQDLQCLVLAKNDLENYDRSEGGEGTLSVLACGKLTLEHLDYFIDSSSTEYAISLFADQSGSCHVVNDDAPHTPSASAESCSQPGHSGPHSLPMDIGRVLAHSLSDLIEQLEGVGIALPGCTEGQWHGTEGLDFSDAYGALASAKAAHLLP